MRPVKSLVCPFRFKCPSGNQVRNSLYNFTEGHLAIRRSMCTTLLGKESLCYHMTRFVMDAQQYSSIVNNRQYNCAVDLP